MRFHTLTFENLCSFYGRHTVDLDALCGDGGMFLIRGVTGAGKSTLLDAISLALYGRTARFSHDSRTPAFEGGKGLPGESDPAHLMSRGTGASFAELEFSLVAETGVRERYRARWSRRRANERSDGNLQAEKRRLARLVDADWVTLVDSDNKAQCSAAFEEALRGLEFLEFQRTTLLAQFRFREFLDAPEHERARILERMTNTERFTRIGALAAARYKLAEERVGELEKSLAGGDSWSDEVRAERDREHASALTERDARRRAHTVELERKDFWSSIAALEETVARHREASARIEAEREANAPILRGLAEHRRTASARARHDGWMRHRLALASAEKDLAAATAARVDSEAEALAAKEEVAKTETAFDAASRRLVARRPALDEATGAWRLAEEQGRAAVNLRARATSARTQAEAAEGRLFEVDGRLARLRDELVENARRRAEVPLAERLVASSANISTLVRLARDAEDDLGLARAELTKVGDELASHTLVIQKLEASLAELEGDASAASAKVAAARADLERETDGHSSAEALGQLDSALRASDGRRERLRALERALDDAARLRKAASDAERTSSEARERAEVAARTVAATVAAEAAARVELEARARNLEVLEGVLGVLPHRHALEPRRPCPVCGSEEHPYRERPERAPKLEETQRLHAQVEASVAEARASLERATTSRDEAGRAEAREAESARISLARRGEFEVELQAAEAHLVEARALVEVALPTREAVAGAREHEDRLCDELREKSVRIRALDRELTEVKKRFDEAESRRLASFADLERERGRAEALDGRLRAARDGDAIRLGDVERARHALESELAGLEVACDDPYEGAAEVQRRVEALEQLERSRLEIEGRLHTIEVERAGTHATREEARRASLEAEASAAAAEAAAASADLAARGLLDGRRPEGVRAELEKACEDERARLETRREEVARVEGSLVAALAQEQLRSVAKVDEAASEREARQALDAELVTLGLSEDAALVALALTDSQVASASELEAGLHARSEHARLGALEATAELAGERGRAPNGALDIPGSDARERVAVLDAGVREAADAADAATHRIGELEAELRRDDEARARRAERQGELEDARGDRDHWRTVHDLIGVDSGKRFMLAVQSLNLERVLSRANESLRLFMPRYELVQVMHATEGPKLDFRVLDNYQCGERRSSKSLSGGESFVVALALALGLASTRGGRLRMETLLIDEGFGALDPATLQVATAALSSLQAALGVRIGLISHVEYLREAVPAQLLVEPVGMGRSVVRPA